MATTEEVTSAHGSVTVPTGTYSPARVDVVLKTAVQDILTITDGIAATAGNAIPKPTGGVEGDVLTYVNGKALWTPGGGESMARPAIFASAGYDGVSKTVRPQTANAAGTNASMSAGAATITTSAAHGLTAGTWVELPASLGWASPYAGLHQLTAGTSGTTMKFTVTGSTQTVAGASVANLPIYAKWQKIDSTTVTLDAVTDLLVEVPVHQVSCTTGASLTGNVYVGVGFRESGKPDHSTLGAYFIVGGNTKSTDYNGSGTTTLMWKSAPAGTHELSLWAFVSEGCTGSVAGLRYHILGWYASTGAFTGDEVL